MEGVFFWKKEKRKKKKRNQKINQRGYLPNKGWKPTRAIWCANYKTNRKSYDDAYLRHIYIINILEQVYLIMHYIYMIQQTPCWLTLHRLKGITKNYSMNPTSLIVLQWLLLWTNMKSLFLDYPLNYVFIWGEFDNILKLPSNHSYKM